MNIPNNGTFRHGTETPHPHVLRTHLPTCRKSKCIRPCSFAVCRCVSVVAVLAVSSVVMAVPCSNPVPHRPPRLAVSFSTSVGVGLCGESTRKTEEGCGARWPDGRMWTSVLPPTVWRQAGTMSVRCATVWRFVSPWVVRCCFFQERGESAVWLSFFPSVLSWGLVFPPHFLFFAC